MSFQKPETTRITTNRELRERLAGQALAGMLADPNVRLSDDLAYQILGESCVRSADAVIRALREVPTP